MKNNLSIFFFIISFINNQENNTIVDELDLFNYNSTDHLLLDLDPYRTNTYILNKYYPHSMDDYYDNGYFIDGSFTLPTFHLISEKIYFDDNATGTISQLSYKQKKTDLYFDAKVAVKFDISDSTLFIIKTESKSLTSNINQNHILYLSKKMNRQQLDLGYMYHIEKSPGIEFTTFHDTNSNSWIEKINNNIESFHLGFKYKIDKINYLFSTSSSLQTSKNKRLLIDNLIHTDDTFIYPIVNTDLYNSNYFGKYNYDQQVFWSNNHFIFLLSDDFNLTFSNKYKRNLYEYNDQLGNIKTQTFKKNILSSTIKYKINDFSDIGFGFDRLNEKLKPHFNFSFHKNIFQSSLILENEIINDLRNPFIPLDEYKVDNNSFTLEQPIEYDADIPNLKYKILNNYRFELFFKNTFIDQKLSFGQIKTYIENYTYYFSDTFINYKWFYSIFEYKKYDANFLFLKDLFKYSISLMPDLKDRRFDPYLNIASTYLYINDNLSQNH